MPQGQVINIQARLNLVAPTDANLAQQRKLIDNALKGIQIPFAVKGGKLAIATIEKINSVTNEGTKRSKDFGEAVANAFKRFTAYSAAVFFVLRLSRVFQQAVKNALQFDVELAKIAQTVRKSNAEIKTHADRILGISARYGVVNTQVAQTIRILSQAGLSFEQAFKGAEILAKTTLLATFEDIKDSTEALIVLMKTFGLSVEEAAKDVAFINVISKEFATEAEDYVSALKRAGGVFRTTGSDAKELAAIFTVVRDTTRESADVIATGFRTIFPRLQRSRTIQFFKDLGIELTKLEGGTEKFIGNLEAIVAIQAGLRKAGIQPGDIRFAEVIEEIGGLRQESRVIPLILRANDAQEIYNRTLNATKETEEDVIKARQQLLQQIKELGANFERLIYEIAGGTGFQLLAKGMIAAANAAIELARELKPLVVLLSVIAGFRFAKASFSGVANAFTESNFGKGFRGGLLGLAEGGRVGGSGSGDRIPALLEPKEFVLPKRASRAIGYQNLEQLRRITSNKGFLEWLRRFNRIGRGFAKGGVVGMIGGGLPSRGTRITSLTQAQDLTKQLLEGLNVNINPKLFELLGELRKGVNVSGGVRRGESRGGSIGLNLDVATVDTLAHEIGHEVDRALGRGGFASKQSGTLQSFFAQQSKALELQRLRSTGASPEFTEYRTRSVELFANFFAGVDKEFRKVLSSTTDLTKGLAELRQKGLYFGPTIQRETQFRGRPQRAGTDLSGYGGFSGGLRGLSPAGVASPSNFGYGGFSTGLGNLPPEDPGFTLGQGRLRGRSNVEVEERLARYRATLLEKSNENLRKFGQGVETSAQKFVGLQFGLFALEQITKSLSERFGGAETAIGRFIEKLGAGVGTVGNIAVTGLFIKDLVSVFGQAGGLKGIGLALKNIGSKVKGAFTPSATTVPGFTSVAGVRAGLSGISARRLAAPGSNFNPLAKGFLGRNIVGGGARLASLSLTGGGIPLAIATIILESLSSLDIQKDIAKAIKGGNLESAQKGGRRQFSSSATLGISEFIPNLVSGLGTIGTFITGSDAVKEGFNSVANSIGDFSAQLITSIPVLSRWNEESQRRLESEVAFGKATKDFKDFIEGGKLSFGKNVDVRGLRGISATREVLVNPPSIPSRKIGTKEVLGRASLALSTLGFSEVGIQVADIRGRNVSVKEAEKANKERNIQLRESFKELVKINKPELDKLSKAVSTTGGSFGDYTNLIEEQLQLGGATKQEAKNFTRLLAESGQAAKDFANIAGDKVLQAAIKANIEAYVKQEQVLQDVTNKLSDLGGFTERIKDFGDLVSGNIKSNLSLSNVRDVGSLRLAGQLAGPGGVGLATDVEAIRGGRTQVLEGLRGLLGQKLSPQDTRDKAEEIISKSVLPKTAKDILAELFDGLDTQEQFNENIKKASDKLNELEKGDTEPLNRLLDGLNDAVNTYRDSLNQTTNAQIEYTNSLRDFENGSRQERLNINRLSANFGVGDIRAAQGNVPLRDVGGITQNFGGLLAERDVLIRGIRGAQGGGNVAGAAALESNLTKINASITLQKNLIDNELKARDELVGLIREEAELEKQRTSNLRGTLEELGIGVNKRENRRALQVAEKIQGGAGIGSLSRRDLRYYNQALNLVNPESSQRIRQEAINRGLQRSGISLGSSFGQDLRGAAGGATPRLGNLQGRLGGIRGEREELLNLVLDAQFQSSQLLTENLNSLNETMNGLLKSGIKMTLDTTNVVVTLQGKDFIGGLAPEVQAKILKEVENMLAEERNKFKNGAF